MYNISSVKVSYILQCICKLKAFFKICKHALKYKTKIMAMEFKNKDLINYIFFQNATEILI